MPNAQLTWAQAAVLGIALVGVSIALAAAPGRADRRRMRALTPVVREAGVIALLYALWQLVGTLAEHGSSGAFARARWIERVQRDWRLPSERTMQQPLLDHPWLGQVANIYYATMHFGVLFALLGWVFWRHRDHYGRVRTLVVAFTGIALLVALIPVAPPRLLPEFGFTDIAAHYGQSVYTLDGVSVDQLSAMPSVHVGWAALAGGIVYWLGSGIWRWAGCVHTAITAWVVTATANHWWLDGIVAVGLLGLVALAQAGWYGLRGRRALTAGTGSARAPAVTSEALG